MMIGKTLGHYRIVEKLGAGGMGVVYRAEDRTLDRQVAIKVLPEAFTGDPERLARFEREAKLLASLNHPNIAAIYGLEEADGKRFLVLELVEGETLAEWLNRGPLPIEMALGVCRQIAEGVEAAHEKGVIHRDLKPGNVKITPEGKVKILDFGLAKAYQKEGSAPDLSKSPTLTDEMTGPGVILGTVAYMSPEQAMGMELDARTDLFSFGAVLYEMAMGIRPFKGNTSAVVFNAMLSQAPTAPVRLNPGVPYELERTINKALEKNREVRYQSAREMLTDLKRLKRDTDSGKAAVSWARVSMTKPRVKWLVVGIATGLALIVLVVTLGLWILRHGRETPETPLMAVPLTSYPGNEGGPQYSPDGKKIAFGSNRSGSYEIWVCDADGSNALQLSHFGKGYVFDHRWPPDSTRLTFNANIEGHFEVYVMNASGGTRGA